MRALKPVVFVGQFTDHLHDIALKPRIADAAANNIFDLAHAVLKSLM